MAKLSVSDIRAAVTQLRGIATKRISLPLRTDIYLSLSGVVIIPGVGWMHPETFRQMAGEEAYQELLKRQRVMTSYDIEDEKIREAE